MLTRNISIVTMSITNAIAVQVNVMIIPDTHTLMPKATATRTP